jgi:aryl-alcohol dehydrogenase-like predicted oxidoreductase
MVETCEHEGMAFISWAPMAQGGLDQTAKPSPS